MTLVVYADDLVLTGNDDNLCVGFKAYLNQCSRIKDLGPFKRFLGIEAAENEEGLFLCYRTYALEIVEECGLLEAKPADFPIETNHKLALVTGKLLEDPTQYQRLVGRLICLTLTRTELSYSIHILS